MMTQTRATKGSHSLWKKQPKAKSMGLNIMGAKHALRDMLLRSATRLGMFVMMQSFTWIEEQTCKSNDGEFCFVYGDGQAFDITKSMCITIGGNQIQPIMTVLYSS
jgi:hypothetical protein